VAKRDQLRPPKTYGAIVQIGAAVALLGEVITAFACPTILKWQRRRAAVAGWFECHPATGTVIDEGVPWPEPEEKWGS
jgi:hypothetical protein